MARCLLILPPLPQRMGAPYLGTQYVAAALLKAGHDVRCVDLAAVSPVMDEAALVELARAWRPHLVGMTLFTHNALAGYRLAAKLRGTTGLLVAGGPHPTVLADEALAHGFDVAVAGEGERAACTIAARLDADPTLAATDLAAEHGIVTASGGQRGAFVTDLDALPWPHDALPAFDARAYGGSGQAVPGGTVTSRGCPARCTFCANYVTGRAFRWRGEADVLAELRALHRAHGLRHFAFWDDAFTAHRPRLRAFMAALLADDELRGSTWTCITPANMVRPPLLAAMAEAGCVAINFGIESGDPAVLRTIAKGQRPDQVREAVRAALGLGMSAVVNFMFGFPAEGIDGLDATLATMRALSDDALGFDAPVFFNNRGVLVPFPGTTIYDAHHRAYGFTGWWLDDRYLPPEPNLHVLEPRVAQRYLEVDPALELDYFRYDPDTRARIARCVRFKARHNQAVVERMARAAGGRLTDEKDALAAAAAAVSDRRG